MSSLFLALIAGIVGAILRWFLPALSDWLRTRKLAKNLLGEWNSTYQGIDEPEGTWIEEKIAIRVPFLSARLILKSKRNSYGYSYSGKGLLEANVHIIGGWESVLPAANARGVFMLTISAQGNMMYGYWVGLDKSGSRRYGRWVLARRTEDLPPAKQLLESMRKPHVSV